MMRLIAKNSFCYCLFVILVFGCGGGGGSGGNSGTPVSLELSCTPDDVNYNGSVTLNWSATNADTCTASGSWSGPKDLTGSETVPSLTDDTSFTLNCNGPGGGKEETVTVTVNVTHPGTATLSWKPPTTNTDNTPLTDLAGYKIHKGSDSGSYSEVIVVNDSAADGFVVKDLAAGTWYFAVSAYNTASLESTKSNEDFKTID